MHLFSQQQHFSLYTDTAVTDLIESNELFCRMLPFCLFDHQRNCIVSIMYLSYHSEMNYVQARWMSCWLNPYEDDQDVTVLVIVFVQVMISDRPKASSCPPSQWGEATEIKHPCRHVVSVDVGPASPSCCLATSELACTEGTGGVEGGWDASCSWICILSFCNLSITFSILTRFRISSI